MSNQNTAKRTRIFYKERTEGAKEYSIIVGGTKTQAQAEKIIREAQRKAGGSSHCTVRVEPA